MDEPQYSTVETTSRWLMQLWTHAQEEHRESTWRSLPGDASHALENHSTFVTMEDVAFLGKIAIDVRMHTTLEVDTALMLLALLVEDGHFPVEHVRPYILDALRSSRPATRNSAVEALWQMGDRSCLPALTLSFMVEEHPDVRRTMYHVLDIMTRAGDHTG